MKFRSHLTELQYRLFLPTITWLTTFSVSYVYSETAVFYLLQSNLPESCSESHYFITTQLAEVFSVHVNIAVFISNQLTWFALVYTLLAFWAPGLYLHEIAFATNISKILFLTWLLSAVLFYVGLMPALWKFFLGLNSNNGLIFFEARLLDYFDAFLLVYSLLNVGTISLVCILYTVDGQVSEVKKLRKFYHLLSFCLAATLTPPDIWSQILVATVFLCLIEIYIAASIFAISK